MSGVHGTRPGWKAVGFVLLLFSLAVTGYLSLDRCYREKMREKYAERERSVRELLEKEKTWIRQNQGKDGEIYLNHTHEKAAGDVNPYFACQAAMGLLAGEPSKEDLEAVGQYLRWHTERLLYEKGEISNCRLDKTGLKSTGKRDSVDSYVAVYLILLSGYEAGGGDPDDIPDADRAVSLCAEKLTSLMKDGLTQVSPQNGTRYLMDNVEVLEGCRAAAEFTKKTGLKNLKEKYLELAETVEAGIYKNLWRTEEGTYEIGLSSSGKPIPFPGWNQVYPDSLAQLFPSFCGDTFEDTHALYQMFCEAFKWERMELGDTRFPWACISYAAVLQGDYERAETYLASFEERFEGNRDYPFHTAESGWACRTGAGLLEFYQERQQTGLFGRIMEELRGTIHE